MRWQINYGVDCENQLWTLRKSLRGHAKGSIVSRSVLEAAYRAGYAQIAGKYGSVSVDAADPAIKAVESS